jgi:hypothetical protein
LADSRGRLNSYILDNRVGMHIKHSSSRMPPWQFGFTNDGLREIENLKAEAGEVWLAFVCGEDGVVYLSEADFRRLNSTNDTAAYVRIDRDKRAMYRVNGSSGRLGKAVRRGSALLVEALKGTTA